MYIHRYLRIYIYLHKDLHYIYISYLYTWELRNSEHFRWRIPDPTSNKKTWPCKRRKKKLSFLHKKYTNCSSYYHKLLTSSQLCFMSTKKCANAISKPKKNPPFFFRNCSKIADPPPLFLGDFFRQKFPDGFFSNSTPSLLSDKGLPPTKGGVGLIGSMTRLGVDMMFFFLFSDLLWSF